MKKTSGIILCLAIFMASVIFILPAEEEVAVVGALSGTLYVSHENSSEWDSGYENMPCYLYDTLKTEANSYADIQFATGGLVAVNENTTIQITGTGEVADQTERSLVDTIIITTGEIWAKITQQQEEIQFQTNGGTVAIKGTEFVIEENPETEETVVSLFEGQISFQDNNNQETVYNAGDEITIPWKGVPVVKHYSPRELKDKLKNKYVKFKEFFQNYLENHPELDAKVKLYMAKLETIKNPDEKAEKILKQLESRLSEEVKKELKAKLNFPYKLSPSRITVDDLNPTFSWNKIEQAEGYWIFLSEDEAMDNIIWNKKIEEHSVIYPDGAKPLVPGNKYYWRVIILDENEEPWGKASQTYFTVSE